MPTHLHLPEDTAQSVPFSQAVVAGDWIHVAGQIATDEPGWAGGDIEAQTAMALQRIGRVLALAGAGYDDVVRVGVFMADLREFERMNAVYRTFFKAGRLPARTCVGVATLLDGCAIEIDCVALRPASSPVAG